MRQRTFPVGRSKAVSTPLSKKYRASSRSTPGADGHEQIPGPEREEFGGAKDFARPLWGVTRRQPLEHDLVAAHVHDLDAFGAIALHVIEDFIGDGGGGGLVDRAIEGRPFGRRFHG